MGKTADSKMVVTEYSMSIHFGVCTEADEVLEIIIGEKLAWSGSVTREGNIPINKPTLFGGIKKEGGAVGNVWVLFGGPLQTVPDFIAARFGLTRATAPGFRGLMSLFFFGALDTVTDPTWTPILGGGGSSTPVEEWTPPGGGGGRTGGGPLVPPEVP